MTDINASITQNNVNVSNDIDQINATTQTNDITATVQQNNIEACVVRNEIQIQLDKNVGITLTAGTGLTGGGSGSAITIALDTVYTDNRYVNVDGDTMTGFLTLHADPTSALHAVTKQYVDNTLTGYITGVTAGTGLIGGGTSGDVTISLNTTYTDGRYLQIANNLSDLSNVVTARTNLGLGSIALLNLVDISDNTNLAVTSPIVLTDDTLSLNQSAIDHSLLSNLAWSVAGHTIDTDVDFSNNDIENVSELRFNIAYAQVAHTEGAIHWNSDDGTLELDLPGGNASLQVGQEIHLPKRIRNNTGSNLLNGQLVYITGATGNKLTVALADASTDATADGTIAMLTEDIDNNSQGYATAYGMVRDVNTSAFAEGALLYLSTTAGGYTDIAPTSPNHRIEIGYVVRQHATEGEIFVNIDNGSHLEYLHDVLLTSVADNDVIQYNSATSLWENISISAFAGTLDHTLLQNVGTNTHAQIDTHIADSTIHFTESSIDHGSISGLGDDDHTQYHNDTRGDARYYTQTQLGGTTTGVGASLIGSEDVGTYYTATNVEGILQEIGSGLGTIITDHGGLTGLADDDHLQYHTDARGDLRYVNLTGDTMTGFLTLNTDPTANLHAATKQYVDNISTRYLPTITQALHGFSELDVIYKDGTYQKAIADGTGKEGLYVVVEVVDTNNFKIATVGRFTSIAHGLTVDEYYYLSSTVAGGLDVNDPQIADPTADSKPMIFVIDADNYEVIQHRNLAGGGGGGSASFWSRSVSTLTPINAGDSVLLTGQLEIDYNFANGDEPFLIQDNGVSVLEFERQTEGLNAKFPRTDGGSGFSFRHGGSAGSTTARFNLYPETASANAPMAMNIITKGSGLSSGGFNFGALVTAWGTDFLADGTNWRQVSIESKNTSGGYIYTRSNGTEPQDSLFLGYYEKYHLEIVPSGNILINEDLAADNNISLLKIKSQSSPGQFIDFRNSSNVQIGKIGWTSNISNFGLEVHQSTTSSFYDDVDSVFKTETYISSDPGASVFARGFTNVFTQSVGMTNNGVTLAANYLTEGTTSFTQSQLINVIGANASRLDNPNATITDLYLFRTFADQTPSSTVTNLYKYYGVASATSATNNYAIVMEDGHVIFNENGDANSDVRMEGDTDPNLFLLDASSDLVTINNLNINGNYTLPTVDGTATYLVSTDGAGNWGYTDPSTIGSSFWQRTGTELTTLNAGDDVQIDGITSLGGGSTTVAADGRLTVGLVDDTGTSGNVDLNLFSTRTARLTGNELVGTAFTHSVSTPSNGIASHFAIDVNVTATGTGSQAGGVYGARYLVSNFNNTNVSIAYGQYNQVTNSGQMGTSYGAFNFINHSATTTMTNARALSVGNQNSTTGTITNSAGLYVRSLVNNSGTVTNNYGIQILDQSAGTNNYAIQTGVGLNDFGDAINITGSSDITQFLLKSNSTQTSDILAIQTSSGADRIKINSYYGIDANARVNTETGVIQSGRFELDVVGTGSIAGNSYYGTFNKVEDTSTKTGNGTFFALYNQVFLQNASMGSNSSVSGLRNEVRLQGGTNLNAATATLNFMNIQSTGLYGAGAAGLAGSRVSLDINSAATISKWFGYYSEKTLGTSAAGSAITDFYNFYAQTDGFAGAVPTNLYGLYIQNVNDATNNNYSIYTNEGDMRLMGAATDAIGFHGATPVAQQTVTGSRGGNAALQDLLTKLANLGIIVDSTT